MAFGILRKWSSILLSGVLIGMLALFSPHLLNWYSIQSTKPYSGPNCNGTGQSTICIKLASELPEQVYSHQHPTYNNVLQSYWSENAAEIQPSCIVRPSSAADVSIAIKTLNSGLAAGDDVRFAVRSGGHSPEAGFASITNGVTIDMSLFDGISVASDKLSATIGVGARWKNVYSRLEDMDLAMVGGRNAHVGVGGLVLGGGISFFSPRFGMVCDNVDAYGIVLANSSIIHATAVSHPDLWRALKGGTGNFGIVTQVTTKVFPSAHIWSGSAYWLNFQASKVLRAFHSFNQPSNFDAYAGGPLTTFAYARDLGLHLVVQQLSYIKPEPWPSVFAPFKAIPWRIRTTLKIQPLTSATDELHSMAPLGDRQFQITLTIKNDLETMEAMRGIYTEQLKRIKSVERSVWALVFQPLSAAMTRKGSPNVLGFGTRHANDTLIIALLCVSWRDAKDDELVEQVSRDVAKLSEDYAREKGTLDPYIYLNYAASGQDVFGGYGEGAKQSMQEVSTKYDPEGFFQEVKQGGFKLNMY
ncbi:Bifunctional solanapyrone synthase [Cercospora zeina]